MLTGEEGIEDVVELGDRVEAGVHGQRADHADAAAVDVDGGPAIGEDADDALQLRGVADSGVRVDGVKRTSFDRLVWCDAVEIAGGAGTRADKVIHD